jgi:hypothetical protein
MRNRRILASIVLALIVTMVFVSGAIAGPRTFKAHLSGGEEVPPAETRAQGQAIFKLSKDGSELRYKLIVANIEGVTQAHIHCAPAGANGPVVAWLYPAGPPAAAPTSPNGVLMQGTLTDANVGSAGCNVDTLAGLIALMEAGNAYVNVHTTTYPAGEIRGQIR